MRTLQALLFTALLAAPTLALAQAGSTDSYTPAQADKAKAAARAAGYDPVVISMAQGGNIFINAKRDGQIYSLTVTPEDKVYASTSNPLVTAAY
jgi:hypothetical protein